MEQHCASGKAKVAVIGGSSSYVKAFTASFTGTLHLSSEVRCITRMENGVQAQFVCQQHET